MGGPAFVVGDVHGHRDALVRLLRDAQLVGGDERWRGGDATLWLVGDLVDRGPDGLGAVELAMRLSEEGDVRCLLGNHELLLLGTLRFGDAELDPFGTTFADVWRINGGRSSDLRRLEPEHVAWLRSRPAVGRHDAWLLLHADTDRYLELGSTMERANAFSAAVLAADDPVAHGHLLDVLSDRGAFGDAPRLDRVLAAFGGDRVVHGHTPVALVLDRDPASVTEPFRYAGGRATNVDHCLFAGGPGFVLELD